MDYLRERTLNVRVVAWNCNMALHRKFDALLQLKPDIAVISECADPERLHQRGLPRELLGEPVWIGENTNKGLAVFAFNGYTARLAEPYYPTLRYIAPVLISGPTPCRLLAVWAQNASAGITRKHQLGPLRRALSKYQALLSDSPVLVAGDFNNNVIWDRPGWRINHAKTIERLHNYGLASAYHAVNGEVQGCESAPTLYWRDRSKEGPTYHLDYIFIPHSWATDVRDFSVGSFERWCGSGLSDHVPVSVEVSA